MPLTRLEQLRNRRLDPMVKTAMLRNEAYNRVREDDAVKYAIGAMQPIDPEYTAVSFTESERVQAHITPAVNANGVRVTYRYQGSVTNDTHIKAHSDIDNLIIHDGFYDLEPPQQPTIPYRGNPLEDLKSLRRAATDAAASGFPQVEVDETGARSVTLTGGSLRREIDLVFANWYNSNAFAQQQHEIWRGIKVLDNDLNTRVENFPFLHNAHISEKDGRVNGSARKMIRLLKSLQYDAEEKNGLSSYDICSLVWNAPDRLLGYTQGQELQLMQSFHDYMAYVDQDANYRAGLKVPNGTRLVFCTEGASQSQLRVLIKLHAALLDEIQRGLQRSFKKLAEARVEY